MMWFIEIAEVEDPGRNELVEFLRGVDQFLGFLLENKDDFSFLWENQPDLLPLARDTYIEDVRPAIEQLQAATTEIPDEALQSHGLTGRPLRFKFRILNSIGNLWEKIRGQFRIRGWLKQLFDAIDAILDSIINAVPGASIGGLIKEFKDALSALVPTT